MTELLVALALIPTVLILLGLGFAGVVLLIKRVDGCHCGCRHTKEA